ncbi:hypothetical protein [Streptomyces sp. adm13(2018)]|uniref:hypothetical protein n=1 Tax=Streptomyces sp. adm13(2018) TaxID=2479007 RepID=UPI001C9CB045|nr:hypothetical protein [Streptomyces sp. adm13(2018)]
MTSLGVSLVEALTAESKRAAAADPGIRGADWRHAVVATVGSDGTVTTTDGIVARRMEPYVGAKAGDVVVITVSQAGGWACWGRFASGSGSAWTAYTPTYAASGGGAALGNGLIDAEYTLNGDECHTRISFVAGSTTTFGSGGLRWGLPFTAAALPNSNMFWAGSAMCSDAGLAYYSGICRINGGGTYLVGISPTTATGSAATEWRATTPFTWANGDYASFGFTYKIA